MPGLLSTLNLLLASIILLIVVTPHHKVESKTTLSKLQYINAIRDILEGLIKSLATRQKVEYKRRIDLNEYRRNHRNRLGQDILVCKLCREIFTDPHKYFDHAHYHVVEKLQLSMTTGGNFPCQMCGNKSFLNQFELYKHCYDEHLAGNWDKLTTNLPSTTTLKPNDADSLYCRICNITLPYVEKFYIHSYQHLQENMGLIMNQTATLVGATAKVIETSNAAIHNVQGESGTKEKTHHENIRESTVIQDKTHPRNSNETNGHWEHSHPEEVINRGNNLETNKFDSDYCLNRSHYKDELNIFKSMTRVRRSITKPTSLDPYNYFKAYFSNRTKLCKKETKKRSESVSSLDPYNYFKVYFSNRTKLCKKQTKKRSENVKISFMSNIQRINEQYNKSRRFLNVTDRHLKVKILKDLHAYRKNDEPVFPGPFTLATPLTKKTRNSSQVGTTRYAEAFVNHVKQVLKYMDYKERKKDPNCEILCYVRYHAKAHLELLLSEQQQALHDLENALDKTDIYRYVVVNNTIVNHTSPRETIHTTKIIKRKLPDCFITEPNPYWGRNQYTNSKYNKLRSNFESMKENYNFMRRPSTKITKNQLYYTSTYYINRNLYKYRNLNKFENMRDDLYKYRNYTQIENIINNTQRPSQRNYMSKFYYYKNRTLDNNGNLNNTKREKSQTKDTFERPSQEKCEPNSISPEKLLKNNRWNIAALKIKNAFSDKGLHINNFLTKSDSPEHNQRFKRQLNPEELYTNNLENINDTIKNEPSDRHIVKGETKTADELSNTCITTMQVDSQGTTDNWINLYSTASRIIEKFFQTQIRIVRITKDLRTTKKVTLKPYAGEEEFTGDDFYGQSGEVRYERLLKKMHKNKVYVKCPYCPLRFYYNPEMMNHIRVKHNMSEHFKDQTTFDVPSEPAHRMRPNTMSKTPKNSLPISQPMIMTCSALLRSLVL
ncbi:hypothetical protein WDU94_002621 [Cyamophila willieti]